MITFCIDAGTRKNCGLALFQDTRLASAWLIDGAAPSSVRMVAFDVLQAHRVEVCQVVLEVPRVYPGRRAQGDPNDLIKLAVAGARVAQVIADAAFMRDGLERHAGSVACIAPSSWKAQTSPDIMCERVLARLDDAERVVVEQVFATYSKKGMPKSLRHNVVDAIGIGLWKTSRMQAGGAGR